MLHSAVAPATHEAGHNRRCPIGAPVEFAESYFGGKRKTMSTVMRKSAIFRGAVDKTAVVFAIYRAI